MWSQIQLPFFVFGLCVCSWETKHICKQTFCNVAGEKGNLEVTLTFSPEHEKVRCPLLRWWTVCLMPCCHMRFQFMPFPGALKQGIDSLVLPLCSASSQGENDVPQNRIGDAVASCCDNGNGAKSPQKQNSLWCRFPWKAMAGQFCGRWGRPQLHQNQEREVITMVLLGDKNGCNCQLHWEKWTLKGFRDGQGEGCGFSVQVSWSAGGVGKFISWLLCYLCK